MKWVRLVFYDYCLSFLCVIFFKVTKKYLMALISPRNSLIMLVIHQRINKKSNTNLPSLPTSHVVQEH